MVIHKDYNVFEEILVYVVWSCFAYLSWSLTLSTSGFVQNLWYIVQHIDWLGETQQSGWRWSTKASGWSPFEGNGCTIPSLKMQHGTVHIKRFSRSNLAAWISHTQNLNPPWPHNHHSYYNNETNRATWKALVYIAASSFVAPLCELWCKTILWSIKSVYWS